MTRKCPMEILQCHPLFEDIYYKEYYLVGVKIYHKRWVDHWTKILVDHKELGSGQTYGVQRGDMILGFYPRSQSDV
jgi:hypothetical protein